MGYKDIHVVSVPSQISEQIIVMIKKRQFEKGGKLPSEKELSLNFSVSRATIREALAILKTLNIVRSLTGKGTFINKELSVIEMDTFDITGKTINKIKSRKYYLDTLELRYAIECEMCDLAAQRATKKDIILIQKAIVKCDEARNNTEYQKAYGECHSAIAKATGNTILTNFQQDVYSRESQSYWAKKLTSNSGLIKQFNEEHREICKSIEERNTAYVRELIRKHFNTIKKAFQNQ